MEMKNICGKIPVELHERLKLEVEELGISIPKYLEMVIEEHMTRKGEKTNMAELRTVAVQVTEDLFSRLKAVLARNGMKQKDFLIGLIEEALEKEEAKWKSETEETEEPEEEPAETEMEEAGAEETEPAEPEPDEEPTKPEAGRSLETEALESETESESMTEPDRSRKQKIQRKQSQQNVERTEESAETELETEEAGSNQIQRKRNQKHRHQKTETKRRKRCREICTVFSQRREADSRNNSIF